MGHPEYVLDWFNVHYESADKSTGDPERSIVRRFSSHKITPLKKDKLTNMICFWKAAKLDIIPGTKN
jgi:hypothetical protein